MKKALILISLLLIPIVLGKQLTITEIYPNPIGSDANEWIEIRINESIFNKTLIISDSSRNTTLQWLRKNSLIAIITTNKSMINTTNCSILYTSRIGNGLNNHGDIVSIYINNTLMDRKIYNETIEGKSIVFNGSETFFSDPSPCIIEKLNLSNENNISNEEDSLRNNSIDNSSNEFLFTYIPRNRLILGETFLFSINSSTPYYYYILNDEGEIVKPKRKSSTTSMKSFTPKERGGYVLMISNDYESRSIPFIVIARTEERQEIRGIDIRNNSVNVDLYLFARKKNLYISLRCGKKRDSFKAIIDGSAIINTHLYGCGVCELNIKGVEEFKRTIFIPCKEKEVKEKIIERKEFVPLFSGIKIYRDKLMIKTDKDLFLKRMNTVFYPYKSKGFQVFNGSFIGKTYTLCSNKTCVDLFIDAKLFTKNQELITARVVEKQEKKGKSIPLIFLGLPLIFFIIKKLNF